MLRHLSQPHATTYISSHTEVFYKKVFLKILQKLQENICVVVSYSYNFNKKEALARGVLWILRNFQEHLLYRAPAAADSGPIFTWTNTNIHTSADDIAGKF